MLARRQATPHAYIRPVKAWSSNNLPAEREGLRLRAIHQLSFVSDHSHLSLLSQVAQDLFCIQLLMLMSI